MKTLVELMTQTVTSLNSRFRCLVARAWGITLILSLLFVSLLFIPATAAYAVERVLTPKEVVEYALTLEKLEADFYRRAIIATQKGGLSSLPNAAKNALTSYGEDEAQHVVDLSSVLKSLGGNPDRITIPVNPNYDAILQRDPFAKPQDFLLALQYVEDTGVAAYKGQVQNLLAAGESGKTVLAAALEIHSVEARHAAGIRYLRQTFYGANVRPWIRYSSEVIYNEDRFGSPTPIPFSTEAFDGFATREEVLALVGPILSEK
ncbi:ferritin-like domain-containing protein [Nostoc sp.]|uniref:ferritin-like domain-containing protein n=1 Tax=Nostoc sp. TaxID=1180 RepID=UPI002FFC5927